MRSCAAYEESIWQAAETGQVSPELAQHLTQCACCRASLQALTNAMRGFLELRAVQAPDPTDAVHARIQRPVWRSRLLPALAGALALLCLTVLLWSAGRQSGHPVVVSHLPELPTSRNTLSLPPPLPMPMPPRHHTIIARAKPKRRRHHHPPLSEMVAETPRTARQQALTPRVPKRLTAAEELAAPCRQYTAIDPNFYSPSEPPRRYVSDPTYCALALPSLQAVREPRNADGW